MKRTIQVEIEFDLSEQEDRVINNHRLKQAIKDKLYGSVELSYYDAASTREKTTMIKVDKVK